MGDSSRSGAGGLTLEFMQHTAENAPTSGSPNFAGLLAALTAPAKKPASSWIDEGLKDDVTTLSYERALQARARYRSNYANDKALTQAAEPFSIQAQAAESAARIAESCDDLSDALAMDEAHFSSAAVEEFAASISKESLLQVASAAAVPQPAAMQATLDKNLKSASITIRLSEAECVQLRQRAAEAGLTVSAYLRSCTFEAESLRAMVKDTMAQLRSATAVRKQAAPLAERRDWLQWLRRLITPWQASQRVARA